MSTFYPEPCLIALPTEANYNGWLGAHLDLLEFERAHTRNHPRHGRVIVLETHEERDRYLQLLDDEQRLRRVLTAPVDVEAIDFSAAPEDPCELPF